MNFLSNILRTAPKTNQWSELTMTISSNLHDVKLHWFDECVTAMEMGIQADLTEKAQVVQTTLNGSAALAITGYQLYCVSNIIANDSYIPRNSVKDFMDLLYGRISCIEMVELLKYVRRFEQMSSESSQQFRLGVEVARYVIHQEPSMLISLHVSSLAQTLFARSSLVIAKAFGDFPRIAKLTKQLKEFSSNPN
jgi:hypothetical protein